MLYPHDFFKHILDNLYDGVYFVDRELRITYWNGGAERLTGYNAADVVGKNCRENLMDHCNNDQCEICKSVCPVINTINTGNPQETEMYLRHANGHRLPVLMRTSTIIDETAKVIGVVQIFSNNQKIARALRRINILETKVFFDPLTGLGNRRNLEIQFHSAHIQMQYENLQHGLLFIDIDHFKNINDRYGHVTGDRVLVMVAGALRSNLRDSDVNIRWGGEEFVALIRDSAPQEIKVIAEKLREMIEHSNVSRDSNSINITVSIGATMLHGNDTIESAIHRADQLMYTSKVKGRNQVTLG